MLICESCGAVFAFPSSQMDNETGCVEEFCPECGSKYISQAVFCKRCEDYVSENDAFGYGDSVVCEDCLQDAERDFDLLYRATKDEYEDYELPVLFRSFFSDDEINEILLMALKAACDIGRIDTRAFVKRHASEIAEEMVKEDEK